MKWNVRVKNKVGWDKIDWMVDGKKNRLNKCGNEGSKTQEKLEWGRG
jgi:hypothetical protein